jgi:hypothetical protein
VKVGSGVGVGLAGVDDGGAVAAGEAVTGALVDAVGPDVALVLSLGLGGADWVADVVGAAELLVGAGAGGPKHPASANREQTPRTLNDESLGLVITIHGPTPKASNRPPSGTPKLSLAHT